MAETAAPLSPRRPARPIILGLLASAPFLALLASDWWTALATGMSEIQREAGLDYRTYISATERFLSGGGFYLPWQLTGHYGLAGQPILYPPESLVLFIPFTVLPAILWWAIPIIVTSAIVIHWRPAPILWPIIAACLWWPDTSVKILAGNPVIWAVMFTALGTIYRWPAAFAALKLTLAPFALIGIRNRWWWVAGFLGLLPFVWLLPDYLTALRNFDSGGLLYSVQELPMMFIPIVAWSSSRPWRGPVRGQPARTGCPQFRAAGSRPPEVPGRPGSQGGPGPPR